MDLTLSLIIPVYRNEHTIDQLLQEITNISDSIIPNLEAIFVVDGSPDNSYTMLASKLPNQKFDSKLISLSRNFGSFTAIRQGLTLSSGDFYAVMAADCQEPPGLIIEAAALMVANEADVVVGSRASRDDPLLYKLFSNIFWFFYRKFIVKDMPRGGVDIFACTNKVRDALLSLPETHTSLVAQIFWVGFRRKEVLYSRRQREDGLKSGWTFRKRINYMSDSIFAFTDIPIRLLLAVGVFGTIFSTLASACVGLSWLFGWIDVPGYTPLILSQLILFMVTILGFGVVGSYVWRAFENTKARPLGVVAIEKEFKAKL